MDIQKRKLRTRILIVMGIVAAVAFIQPRVTVPLMQSVKYHAFLSKDGTPEKGDYVNVQVQNRIIDLDKAVVITKRVACVAGEKLEYRADEHFCDGQSLGRVLVRTGKGLPLQGFQWDGVVPPNKVFLSGDHPRSFDSRYFGFVDIASLQRLTPLF
jgi:conjugal transfer pilin signal peptidase TrbI